MSAPEPSERPPGHDPHFLAQVHERLEAILRDEEAPHWFAVSPMPMPRQGGGVGLGMMLCVWRMHSNGVMAITSMDSFSDFMNFVDDEGTLEKYVAGVVERLRDAYFGGTQSVQKPPPPRLYVPGT